VPGGFLHDRRSDPLPVPSQGGAWNGTTHPQSSVIHPSHPPSPRPVLMDRVF
jgi:hypothetical protein